MGNVWEMCDMWELGRDVSFDFVSMFGRSDLDVPVVRCYKSREDLK